MGIRTVTRGGFSFKVVDEPGPFNNEQWNFWNDFEVNFEPDTFKILSTLQWNDFYVDVGAWIGPTVLWASLFTQNITAFEPDPIAWQYLLRNVDLNCDEVKLQNVAIGREKDILFMNVTGDSNSKIINGEGWPVVVAPLDALIDRADFIKIDTEGFEYEVLCGAERIITAFRPRLLVSMHPGLWDDPKTGDLVHQFLNMFYDHIETLPSGDLYVCNSLQV